MLILFILCDIQGPITEELVFRSCIVPIHLLSSHRPLQITLVTPLFFGISHMHHLYEFLLLHRHHYCLGIFQTLFQFTYTTMFGWFATFVFLRTGSVWNAVLAHMACNYIGVPNFGRLTADEDVKRMWGQWVDWVHWAGHVVGLVGFCAGLWWATESAAGLLRKGDLEPEWVSRAWIS